MASDRGLFRGLPFSRKMLLGISFGMAAGIVFMVTLIEFDHYTSTEAFCTSCHSMEIAAISYRQSSHYNPTSGVRASCGDCHVSEGIFSATFDHAMGAKDLFNQIKGKLVGPDYDDPVINTLLLPESAFTAREWFNERGSASCQRCHVSEAIMGTRVGTQAVHSEETKGRGCVECHINLVHRKVPDQKTFKRAAWNRMVEEEFGLEAGSADRLFEQFGLTDH
jgi:nitrate/TMAO reductase-like tetraheme cytochrome c subunit